MLMFGSAFRNPEMYPNMIPMPMPSPQHLDCFTHWIDRGSVCEFWRARTKLVESDLEDVSGDDDDDDDDGGDKDGDGKGSEGDVKDGRLIFGEEFGLHWDDLVVSSTLWVYFQLFVFRERLLNS